MFEDERDMFGLKRKIVTGERRELFDEFHNL
jgi:hypothetical protein